MSEYLTQVSPNLQAIGTDEDLLYYSNDQVKVSSVQFCNKVGKYKRSLTSLQFGSLSEVKIANWDFLGNIYLQLNISGIPNGASLCDGWGLNAIRSISYTWGTSSSSLLKINQYDLIHHNFMSCETREKSDAMLFLAGQPKSTTDTFTTASAQILLKFPWSVMSACDKKKMFDTRLLNDPIVLTIEFNTVNHFMGYDDGIIATLPTGFSSANVILKQVELSNHSDSLKMEMLNDSSLIYVYPFIHLQQGTKNRFNIPALGTEYNIKTQLLGFLSSDLIGILFSVVKVGDTQRDSTTPHVNPLHLIECRDILLEYNGQTLMDYPGNMLDLDMLTQRNGDPKFSITTIKRDTGQTPAPKTAHVYYLQFTQHENLDFKEEFNNTMKYSSQPLDLSFNIALTADGLDGTQTGDYILNTTYMYNAYCGTQNGITRINIG